MLSKLLHKSSLLLKVKIKVNRRTNIMARKAAATIRMNRKPAKRKPSKRTATEARTMK